MAQNWLNQCRKGLHEPKKENRYFAELTVGQNLALNHGSGKPPERNSVFREAINMWFEENKNFPEQKINSYEPTERTDPNWKTGHFTQMIWATTTKVNMNIFLKLSPGLKQITNFFLVFYQKT